MERLPVPGDWRDLLLPRDERRSMLTLGVFDGVHRGHRALLATAASRARAAGLRRVHLGFDPHPDELLRGRAPSRLLDALELDARLAAAGVDLALDLPFTPALRDTAWDTFLATIVEETRAAAITLSPESAFGLRREGTLERVRAWGRRTGLAVHGVREARYGGLPIRSTRIRASISGGDLAAATAMLGRPFAVVGIRAGGSVVAGAAGDPWLLPPSGSYRVRVGAPAGVGDEPPALGRLAREAIVDAARGQILFADPERLLGALPEGGRVRVALLGPRVDGSRGDLVP